MQGRLGLACGKGFRSARDRAQKQLTRGSIDTMAGKLAATAVLPATSTFAAPGQVFPPAFQSKTDIRKAGFGACSSLQMSPSMAFRRPVDVLLGREGRSAEATSTGFKQMIKVHYNNNNGYVSLNPELWSVRPALRVPENTSVLGSIGFSEGVRCVKSYASSANVKAPVSQEAEADGNDGPESGDISGATHVINKAELVARLAASKKHSKVQATDWLNAILVELSEAVKKDEKVHLRGFGTFEGVERTFRVPAGFRAEGSRSSPNESVTRTRPTFSSGKALMALVNDHTTDGSVDGSSVLAEPRKLKKTQDESGVGFDALTERLGARMDHTAEQASHWLETFLTEIALAQCKGEKVNLTGFGSFERKEREYKVPARDDLPSQTVTRSRISFTAGKLFVSLLNDPDAKPVAPDVKKKLKEPKAATGDASTKAPRKKSTAKAPA